jgi:hypothetical protein
MAIDVNKSNILLRRSAEILNYKLIRKFISIGLTACACAMTLVYVAAALYNQTGSYTVSINKFDNVEYSLILSETPDFKNLTTKLNAKSNERITNICVDKDVPEGLDMLDGAHSGDDYIAYTYYVMNNGQKTMTYEYVLTASNITNNLDKAIRLALYVDGEKTVFATRAADGGAEPVCPFDEYSIAEHGYTTPFMTQGDVSIITRQQIANFEPGEMTKFTIVIWIEGDDPDCTDDLIEGTFKVDMTMSLIDADSQTSDDYSSEDSTSADE